MPRMNAISITKNTKAASRPTQKPPVAVFLAATVLLFFCAISAADSIGFVPDYIDGTTPDVAAASTDTAAPVAIAQSSNQGTVPSTSAMPTGIEPVKLIIPAANMNLPVQNPTTTDVSALDALLKNGPAHYVGSADLGQSGNLIIFAHSSHLPIVTNKMFQAFNNVPNLNAGDSITILGSDGKDYNYSVVSVVKADTNDGTTIDTSPSQGTNLTLVTCDTLTGVSARFVLTATYIGVSNAS
jgi:LPXTG-site transpeptidase (sortase) family protein